jgi:hypothetical protein
MSGNDMTAFEHFLHGQVECWNNSDKEGFLAHYRRISPNGLTIEYVGRPPADAWAILENMWQQQQPRIRIEVVASILNGNEAACHHRNRIIGTDDAIDTIELYKYENGRLAVRYFIKQ